MITQPTTAVRLRPTVILLTMLVAVLGLVLGCGAAAASTGESGGQPVALADPNTVVVKNFAFEPASLTVARGARVTVLNQDQTAHTVIATDKSFDTGSIAGGQRGGFTAPSRPGSYSYICNIHQYMSGTLIVK